MNRRALRQRRVALGAALVAAVIPVVVSAASAPRPHDGVGVHPADPSWGAAGTAYLRLVSPRYGDGVSEPIGPAARVRMPMAREVSNGVAWQDVSLPNAMSATDMLWVWGQFLDHDITLTPHASPEEAFDIPIPRGDPVFDPNATGRAKIPLSRSAWAPASGTSRTNPRQQINAITAFIDASQVYGSDARRARALRRNDGTGLLKTSRGKMLPFNREGLDNAGGTSRQLYLAGDIRANEQSALLVMHTLFVREHNRIARQLRRSGDRRDGDAIYEAARAQVAALIQAVTYREFIPLLLGPDALPRYRGFRSQVNPSISNVFATAAFRVGHTMVSPVLLRRDAAGLPIPEGDLSLVDAFFNPREVNAKMGIEPYLRGLTQQPAQEVDTRIIDELRNLLFGPPGAGGADLAALNIQRGRDHGLGGYNDAREAVGLPRVRTFGQINSAPEIVAELAAMYQDPDDIDVWVGGLAEEHLPEAMVGPLLHAILVDQFTRLRDGDPNWYENIYSGSFLRQLRRTRLSDVIRRNTTINRSLPRDVFRLPGN